MVFYEYDNISYSEILRKSLFLYKTYGNLISVKSLGFSHDGREIISICMGKNNKNKFLYTAGVHGRESINPAVFLMVIEEYAKKYQSNMKIKELLDNNKLMFIPVINPDGYEIAREGYSVIHNELLREYCKSFKIKYYLWKYNARAVDINRNFESSSFVPTLQMPYDSSEYETKILKQYMTKEKPDIYIDFHSRGRAVYWHRKAMNREYNERQLYYAKKLSEITGYELINPKEELDEQNAGGNTVHYASEILNIPSFTIETVNEQAEFPLDKKYYEIVFKQIKYIPLKILPLL